MWQAPRWCFLPTPLHPLPLPTLCVASLKGLWSAGVIFSVMHKRATRPSSSFLPFPLLPPICTAVMCVSVQMWNPTKTEFEHWQRFGSVSLSLSHLSTSPLLPVIISPFYRNSEASSSSRHISLLPVVTWHRRPDPPSARMVSTTVSNSFFIITLSSMFFSEFCESLEAFTCHYNGQVNRHIWWHLPLIDKIKKWI